tara:strand:+ start:7630 stop:8175 length:546 start_codon:yes stop_codon:yes gene_type:complete
MNNSMLLLSGAALLILIVVLVLFMRGELKHTVIHSNTEEAKKSLVESIVGGRKTLFDDLFNRFKLKTSPSDSGTDLYAMGGGYNYGDNLAPYSHYEEHLGTKSKKLTDSQYKKDIKNIEPSAADDHHVPAGNSLTASKKTPARKPYHKNMIHKNHPPLSHQRMTNSQHTAAHAVIQHKALK